MSGRRIGWIGCGVHANEMLLPQLTRHDVTLAADPGRLVFHQENIGGLVGKSIADELVKGVVHWGFQFPMGDLIDVRASLDG